MHNAKKEQRAVTKESIHLHNNLSLDQEADSRRTISIEAIPLETLEPHYLVLFHESPNLKPETNKVSTEVEPDDKDKRIRQLED